MAFKFGMQQILQYRQGLEDMGREELAKRKRKLDEASHKLDILRDEQEKTVELWREHSGGEMDILYLNNTFFYMQRIAGNIQKQSKEKEKRLQKVNEQREAVKKCWQDKRVMEILKEQCYCDYLDEEKKTERNYNDDLSLKGFMRKRSGMTSELM